jgi:uncharacterized membrane protein
VSSRALQTASAFTLKAPGTSCLSAPASETSANRKALELSWRPAACNDHLLLLSSVFLGAASGLRSQLGVATVVARSGAALPPVFRNPWTKRLLAVAAAGELVADKLPSAPSRLSPPGIASRLVLGALAAGLLAQTRGDASWFPAAVVGASSAVVAAKVGHDVRARLARRVPDPAVAVAEDAVALALAAAGASR